LFREVGDAEDEDDVLPHWSATLVAAVTVNGFAFPAVALEFMLEFVPEVAVAEDPEAMLPDPSCPVTCTSFPINVRTAFKSPVNLYALPDLSVSV
jgi:hypothetical protein